MQTSSVSKSKKGEFTDFTKSWPKISTCSCQATIHPLALNCINCGKVICDADLVSSDCTFCGMNLANLTEHVTKTKLKKIQRLQSVFDSSQEKVATSCNTNSSYGTALERRDRLVEFGANSAERTAIFDESTAFDTPEEEEQIFLEFSITGNSVESKLVSRKKT